MSEDINLLRRRKKAAQPKHTLLALRLAAIAFLFMTSFVSVTLLFLQLRSPLGDLKKEESIVLSNVSHLAQKTAKFLFIADRIPAVKEVTEKRPRFDATLEMVQALIPQNIAVVSLRVERARIALTVTSLSLVSLDALMTNFTNAVEKKSLFKKITINGIALDPTSTQYTLSAEADLL